MNEFEFDRTNWWNSCIVLILVWLYWTATESVHNLSEYWMSINYMYNINIDFQLFLIWRRTYTYDFLHLLVRHNTLELPVSFFSAERFWNIGEFWAKKHFRDYRTANTVQLFVAIKRNFSSLFFFWTFHSKGKFPRDYLINLATYLFAYH